MKGGAQPRISPDDHKAWPVDRWAALLAHVRERLPQALILLVGAPGEAAFLESIRAAARPATAEVAVLPLRRLFALCAAAHSMISVDTGPAHAAAAVGLPLVVLFGAYPARVWQPRSALGSPVIGVGGPPAASRLDAIAEPVVFEAWCRLLGQMSAAAPTLQRVEG